MTQRDIDELSYVQFQNLVASIGKRINWDLKLAMISTGNPNAVKIEEEDFPLTSSAPTEGEERVFRLKDAIALQGLAGNS